VIGAKECVCVCACVCAIERERANENLLYLRLGFCHVLKKRVVEKIKY